jgi:hypothetical protein
MPRANVRRSRYGHKADIGMTRSFDLVRKDGTVVNQDGDGARDIL